MAFVAGPVPIAKDPGMQPLVDRVWRALQDLEIEVAFFRLEEKFAEPDNPVEGMAMFADGTSWNPGSGRGLYRFTSAGVWERI